MKLHLLKILDRVAGDGLSRPTLKLELELVTRKRPGDQELDTALHEMTTSGLITQDRDDLTDDTVYQLTPAGTARARA